MWGGGVSTTESWGTEISPPPGKLGAEKREKASLILILEKRFQKFNYSRYPGIYPKPPLRMRITSENPLR